MMPTASAVLSDIVDIARNIVTGAGTRIPILGLRSAPVKPAAILPMREIQTPYYFRFSAADQPGVLSRISGILGDCGISIKIVHQKGRRTNGSVPVVMITHLAKEEHARKALEGIRALDSILDEPVVIRIEDNEY
jgi:homoserine dehydrogenase